MCNSRGTYWVTVETRNSFCHYLFFGGNCLKEIVSFIFASVILILCMCTGCFLHCLTLMASIGNYVFFILFLSSNREGFLMMIVQTLWMSWTPLLRKARVSIDFKQIKNRRVYQLRRQIQCRQMKLGKYFPLPWRHSGLMFSELNSRPSTSCLSLG